MVNIMTHISRLVGVPGKGSMGGTSSGSTYSQSTVSSSINGSASGNGYNYATKTGSTYGSYAGYASGDVKQSSQGVMGGHYGKAPAKTTTASSVLKKKLG